MDCNHKNEYFYQTFMVGTERRRHWLTFCTVCGERTSSPWCKKPPEHIQQQAKEYRPHGH